MTYQLIHVTTPQDWESYHDIRRTELWIGRGALEYDARHPDEYRPHHHPLLLKWQDKPIGVARLDELEDGAGAIRRVAITHSHQRQGHGRMMGQLVEDEARRIGIRSLYVNAAADAVGFYKKTGWEAFIWNPNVPSDGRWPVVQMRKILTP
ncbi:MAG: GNAT family N-acetyltransferase [Alphaproteobacteria bacterium]|nr:MAG: GNAT family N-acetyltransferase [Alphaproteobacteria bacterium]